MGYTNFILYTNKIKSEIMVEDIINSVMEDNNCNRDEAINLIKLWSTPQKGIITRTIDYFKKMIGK